MSDWRELYSAALLEKDPTCMEALLIDVETAIFKRMQELAASAASVSERREMLEVVDKILALRVEKLGWRSPCQPVKSC